MVSDAEDLSTPELVRRIADAMNRRVRLVRVPEFLLHAAGAVLHKRDQVARLCGSLAVDVSRTRHALGWTPPLSLDEGLARTVESYLKGRVRHGK